MDCATVIRHSFGYGQTMAEMESEWSPEEKNQTILVVEEQATIEHETIETAKVQIKKTVVSETENLNIPLSEETYKIERTPVNSQLLDQPPVSVKQDGDTTVISVVREVLITQKKYEVLEEIRITRVIKEKLHTENVILRKEKVEVGRTNISSL